MVTRSFFRRIALAPTATLAIACVIDVLGQASEQPKGVPMPTNISADPKAKANAADAESGLVTLPSAHSVAETARRLETQLTEKGIHLFAKIDHADGAKKAGLALRPTLLMLFGNAKAGTPLMQSKQTIGIDLPLKALVWEDEAGRVWLTYNQPEYLARRHAIRDREEAVKTMTTGLAVLARAATSP
jgi:uncharacterized protein (DUF302 family)